MSLCVLHQVHIDQKIYFTKYT